MQFTSREMPTFGNVFGPIATGRGVSAGWRERSRQAVRHRAIAGGLFVAGRARARR